MTRRMRFLGADNRNSTAAAGRTPEETEAVDSDFVVILAALLCALICVLGLIAVARCAWLRRFTGGGGGGGGGGGSGLAAPQRPANKGLKKKVLRSIPKLAFTAEYAGKLADCAICLTEFAVGDEIRVLPQCGHGFHVGCIDTWLGSHSSCPSCRQILVVARCQKCGGLPPTTSANGGARPAEATRPRSTREVDDATSRYLP